MSQINKKSDASGFFGSVRARLFLVVGLFAMGLLAVVVALSWIDGQTIYDARRSQLMTLSQAAYKVVEQQYKDFTAGKISEPEAQERAKAAVRAIRYNAGDYFFIQDDKIVTIVHGARPDQEGVDGSRQVDANGKLFSAAMHDTAVSKGEGFVDYLYAKPGADMKDALPKLSFVKYFQPWKWTIGTGVYIDDVRSEIWQRTTLAVVVGLTFLLAVGGFAAYVIFGLTRRLDALSRSVVTLAEGQRDVALPPVTRNDEIGRMVQAVQTFKDAAIEKGRLEVEAAETRRHAEQGRTMSEADKAEEGRRLQSAVEALGEGMSRLSGGDLMFRIEVPFQGGIDKLRADFNETARTLQETMTTVDATSSAIRSGTDEISAAADDLSRRTEQQAASLEETAAALDEITATVRKTAEGASHAREVVGTAKADAERSGVVVRQAVEAMSGIEKSSQQIGQIIGVIDEIAFQTNLLALNAGVEAARAGEAGRGFAVVASEVRALAQRSAEAAKEIKALISASAHQVEGGVALVGQTGEALARIVAQVTEINTVVAEIAASAKEQATGLNEVNTAVNQMDQVTQQNAAMVEETTAASHSLARESEALVSLIGRFQLGQGSAPELVRPVRKAAGPTRPAPKPVAAMKTTGRGGAARKPQPAAAAAGWEEF